MPTTKWTIKRVLKTVWIIAGLLFTCWLFYSYQAKNVDPALLAGNKTLTAEQTDDYYLFTPLQPFTDVLIFYPGAMVETKAYVPLCNKLATKNIQVYLIKMPWRLASKGYNKPKELNLLTDSSKKYILAGHSQGAKMAAQFVYENPGLIDRLVLIGTTHPRDISLTEATIPILKIYGSNDGVADEKTIIANKSKLPSNTILVKIDGANHSQFGYYGFQLGDDKAGISREQQLQLTVNSIMDFLNSGH
ncbi:alpha/beta hydrolase [Lacibacter luteus]|uniref:Alpha/beta hydrolase n=1 Tax=Lacibacter luteus TaxID=2508719 RepID=A0A4Q1CIH3_9BACT|nr:alpha/beta hydrolase [Lacibacter luteus]RXK60396.1 alpha/beta hydrolase [Lacibacter luteus]